jgi:hypothetical protein
MGISNPVEQVKAIASACSTMRGTCLVLVQSLLGCTAEELAQLTVGEARRRVGVFPHEVMRETVLKAITRYARVHGLEEGDYFLRSRKGGGSKPVNRVTVWRVLSEAVSKVMGKGSVMMALRGIHRALVRGVEEQLREAELAVARMERRNPLRAMVVAGATGSYRYVSPSGTGSG